MLLHLILFRRVKFKNKARKNQYQYYKSRENQYQYYKSRENLYQVLHVTHTASERDEIIITIVPSHSFVAVGIVIRAVHS